MLRLLPLVLLANTVNSQDPNYSYRSEIEIGFECEILNCVNTDSSQLNVVMEFRYEGTIDFNSAYDKRISISYQYGSIYYYVDSELLYQTGFSHAAGFTFYDFELNIDCDLSTLGIEVDFGYETYDVGFNVDYWADYIYDLADYEAATLSTSYYIISFITKINLNT